MAMCGVDGDHVGLRYELDIRPKHQAMGAAAQMESPYLLALGEVVEMVELNG